MITNRLEIYVTQQSQTDRLRKGPNNGHLLW